MGVRNCDVLAQAAKHGHLAVMNLFSSESYSGLEGVKAVFEAARWG